MKKHICDLVFIIFLVGFINVLGNAYQFSNTTKEMLSFVENFSNYSQQFSVSGYKPLYVGLTLIPGAAAKGAGMYSVFAYFSRFEPTLFFFLDHIFCSISSLFLDLCVFVCFSILFCFVVMVKM